MVSARVGNRLREEVTGRHDAAERASTPQDSAQRRSWAALSLRDQSSPSARYECRAEKVFFEGWVWRTYGHDFESIFLSFSSNVTR